jgi:hypothetical protein
MKRKPYYRTGAALVLILALLFSAGVVFAQSSMHYSIRFDVISGGGGEMDSMGFANFGTLGQSSPVGYSKSTGYANYAGFWYLLEPDVSVSLSAWNFERVFLNQASPPKTFTIRNPGTGDLVIGDLGVAGSSEFSLQNDECSNKVLGPTEFCTYEVVFSPISLGSKTATVSIPSNDEETPLTVGLSGRGVLLMVDPEEGTVGTLVRVGGSGFGAKKGKVLVGMATLKIQTPPWEPSLIHGTLAKLLPPGAYDVTVIPKEPKGAPSITEPGGFTLKVPEIGTVTPPSGAPLSEAVITGKFLGTKKGKVYLEKGGLSKACKVVSWVMAPDTGASMVHFLVPKGFAPDTYTLKVTGKVGSGTGSFTVTE